jgi:hypothetical protein
MSRRRVGPVDAGDASDTASGSGGGSSGGSGGGGSTSDSGHVSVISVTSRSSSGGSTSGSGSGSKNGNGSWRSSASLQQQQQQPPRHARNPMLQVIPFILVTELCERLAFFGFTGSLPIFFTKVYGYSNNLAAELNLLFVSLVFMSPIFGAWVADTYTGRFKAIITFGSLYVLPDSHPYCIWCHDLAHRFPDRSCWCVGCGAVVSFVGRRRRHGRRRCGAVGTSCPPRSSRWAPSPPSGWTGARSCFSPA